MLLIPILPEDIHPLAVKICELLSDHNYQAFVVGGCVRDLLLGAKPKDWDICTDASPEKVMEIFPKNIPTGLQHGTVTVVMGEDVSSHFEVTTFRVEGKYLDGRRPESVSFVTDVKEDLARRDLTINAMAYDPIRNELIDPFMGQQDLQEEIIRAVGNPAERFQEDGLRIMRTARFAARFKFNIDEKTVKGMKQSLVTLKRVSKERINDELSKILMTEFSMYGISTLKSTGALDIACPSLAGLSTSMLCKGELETRLAFLYKRIPIKEVERELNSLKFSNKEIKRVIFLLNLFEKYTKLHLTAEWDIPAYKDFAAYLKNETPDTYQYSRNEFIAFASACGCGTGAHTLEMYEERCPVVHARKEMLINGDDLIARGLKPGPQIKKILDACYAEILSTPEHNEKEFLLGFAGGSILSSLLV